MYHQLCLYQGIQYRVLFVLYCSPVLPYTFLHSSRTKWLRSGGVEFKKGAGVVFGMKKTDDPYALFSVELISTCHGDSCCIVLVHVYGAHWSGNPCFTLYRTHQLVIHALDTANQLCDLCFILYRAHQHATSVLSISVFM